MSLLTWVIAAGLVLISSAVVGRAEAAGPVHLEPVLSGLSDPVYVTSARDGSNRLFVVEQGGVIKVVHPGSTTPSVFLDIHLKVATGGERGLLGVAFHPDFSVNRRFFVDYTRKSDGAIVIAEYRASVADADVAEPAETVILVVAHPLGNHNGGMLDFGLDGFLYIGMGDGGSANDPGNRAQNVNELLGKILRIDVDHADGAVPYSSPGTNPFAGATPGRDEIFAYGFRNPWRFSFDRLTGELYVGDVGQSAREEIDLVTLGGNYGWRIREGAACTANDPAQCDAPGLLPPLLDYKHKNGRCSVTGGYVYRGSRDTVPAGTYVFADYCSGEIFQRVGAGRTLLFSSGFFVASFGEDEAGEIYVVDHGGAVYRLAADASPCSFSINPPVAAFPAAPRSATVSVATTASCAWSATSHDAWIAVRSGGSGAGSGTVHYTVAANPGIARTGTLTIADQTLTVTQSASPLACLVSIRPPLTVVSSRGGSGTVAVSIGAGCAWTAVSNSPWITVTSGPGGAGTGAVSYTVAPGGGFRSGSITIAGRLFKVFSF